MSGNEVNPSRRRFLTAATTVIGGVGVAFALVPFISSMQPSAKARAAGAPVRADISKLEPGQMIRVKWRGKPVWIVDRTQDNARHAADAGQSTARPGVRAVGTARLCQKRIPFHQARVSGADRYLHPSRLLADLSPGYRAGRSGQGVERRLFLPLPRFPFRSGRACLSGVPAPTNLPVPPHRYLSATEHSDR